MIRKLFALVIATAALGAVSAPGAEAEFGIAPGTLNASLSTTQAGAHPDLTTSFMMNTRVNEGVTEVDGNLEDVRVQLPTGFSGIATATARCEPENLMDFETGQLCPASSQVGISVVYANTLGATFSGTVPVFNMVPAHNGTAQFGFRVLIAEQEMFVRVRPSDGGLEAVIPDVPEGIQFVGTSMTLWGVPGSPVHDAQRGKNFGCFGDPTNPENCFGGGEPSTVGMEPFLTNPTECTGEPLVTRFSLNSWQEPDNVLQYEAPMGTITGCDRLHFDPSLKIRPTTQGVDSPAGLSAEVAVPQNEDPNGLATANLRRAVVQLPEGMTLNPAAANGLASCGDARLGLGQATDPSCPPASAIGTVTLHTPALPAALTGPIYVRPQVPGDPYRIALVLQGAGVTLKVPGSVHADPKTGRLTAVFDDTPQQPFSDLQLTLRGGPNAPIAMPTSCGTAKTTGTLTPWSAPESGQPAEPWDAFEVRWDDSGAPCPASLPFAPGLSAGVTNPVAGASSPLIFEVTREDRQQMLSVIDEAHLPAGLMADISSVSRCDNADANAGKCGSASQIGEALISSGAGALPVQVKGRVYLTEGYKGAPFGLAIVVPAVAGPFDLGTAVVRAQIDVDPTTAEVSVKADPMPTILEGTPLRIRDIALNLDRPGFAINPTDCDPMKVTAKVVGTEGAVANLADRFQVTDCSALGFKPSLSLKLTGATHRSAHPALRTVLKAREGDANIGRAVVTLPKTEFLENAHIRTICTRVQYAADNCPKGSVYGYAKAWSPLLDEPLQGPVYLRSSNHPLPDLVASLDGQIHIDLDGRIDSVHSRMRATFDSVPDAPVSKFVLNMQGGSKGLLVNNSELCQAKARASAQFTGHNGKVSSSDPLVKTDCGKGGR